VRKKNPAKPEIDTKGEMNNMTIQREHNTSLQETLIANSVFFADLLFPPHNSYAHK